MQKYDLPTNDPFKETFDEFQETATFKRLQKKFAPLPYYLKYKALRMLTLIASYVFNIFSALTAATLVFFFVDNMAENWIISGAVTIVFIVILEIAKRLTASRFFQTMLQFKKFAFGLFIVALMLTGVSITFSFFGSQKGVKAVTPPPIEVNIDSLTATHSSQIASINQQIKAARNTTYRGTTTQTSQRTIEALTVQLNAITAQKIALEDETRTDNKTTVADHATTTELNASHFALFTLLLEALFLLCAWYLEYYDFRSLAEFAMVANGKNDSNPNSTNGKQPTTGKPARARGDKQLQVNGIPINGAELDEGVIRLAIKKVRNKITSAQYRIRNQIGRIETNRRNKEAAELELQQLQQVLNVSTT